MKTFFKKVLIVCSSIFLVLSSISANKSNWSGMDLSQDEITNSINFQTARGGNCIGESKKLNPILNRFIEKKIDIALLENVLGKPSEVFHNQNGIKHIYFLTERADKCRLTLNLLDGNLISYSNEGCDEPMNINFELKK